jgi:hypothetical protein
LQRAAFQAWQPGQMKSAKPATQTGTLTDVIAAKKDGSGIRFIQLVLSTTPAISQEVTLTDVFAVLLIV